MEEIIISQAQSFRIFNPFDFSMAHLLVYFCISLISFFGFDKTHHVQGVGTTTSMTHSSTYIVRVQNHTKPSVFVEAQHWYKATLGSLVVDGYDDSNPLMLHVYKTVFHGFAATLTPEQAQQLSDKPEVISVTPDRLRQLCTTRSPSFLGLYNSPSYYNDITKPGRLLNESDSASNVIIGFLDSGIYPEHPSFHDDPEELGPIPSRWKGECLGLGDSFTCNNKIIGARYFPTINSEEHQYAARETSGHGTATASIAAGRPILGYAATAVGVAPKARIAVYKVCRATDCVDSSIIAGFDKALEDGVDVISLSFSIDVVGTFSSDPVAVGSFVAMEMGVPVIAAAGNYGPGQRNVDNVSPWMTTVGASTIDRRFPADLVLGGGRVINGASLYSGPPPTSLPLVDGGNCSSADGLSSLGVSGKIVVCDASRLRGTMGMNVLNAGGRGVVLAKEEGTGNTILAEDYAIPGLCIDEITGTMVRDYINDQGANATAMMVFRGTELGIKPATVVASFSARGPSPGSSYVLKPDLIAPGVDITAASIDGNLTVQSGTSISSAHVAGLAALLKGAHREWSPAMIRSAMMTTDYTQDKDGKPILDGNDYMEATAWAMGAGHVDPEKAVDPGLVYDITVDDYLDFMCTSSYSADRIRKIINKNNSTFGCGDKQPRKKPWDLNYPAISVEFSTSGDQQLLVVKRTVAHVGEGPTKYTVTVTNPRSGRINVTVDPLTMEFIGYGEYQSYEVTIGVVLPPDRGSNLEEGKIVWLDSDGRREVVSPVVVAWT